MFSSIYQIKWEIGQQYPVEDIMSYKISTLEGFIINQIPVSWKDRSGYRNRSDRNQYFVLSYDCEYTHKKRFALAEIRFLSWLERENPYTNLGLQGIEYADSIDGLIRKLQENYVFTRKITYDAQYKEGYQEKDMPES